MPAKTDIIRTAACACGQVELEGRGAPIIHTECYTYAPVRLDFPGKTDALARMEELKAKIISGELKVPTHPDQLQPANMANGKP